MALGLLFVSGQPGAVYQSMFDPNGPSFVELAEQGLSSTERGYDLLAPKFDRTPFRTPDVLLQGVSRVLAGRGSVASALDLCCGTGAGLEMLLPHVRSRLMGLDFSRNMLEVARQRLRPETPRPETPRPETPRPETPRPETPRPETPRAPTVELQRGDALKLNMSAEFELCTCFGALGHVRPEDEVAFVRGVARALVPGGRFMFLTAHRPPLWSPARWLAEGYNAVTRVRNRLSRPAFHMYYLRFVLPDIQGLLTAQGFGVTLHSGVFPGALEPLVVLEAQRL